MIQFRHGDYEASCDFCAHGHESGVADDFSGVVQQIKAFGWKVSRDGNDWSHKCPDCAKPGSEFKPIKT